MHRAFQWLPLVAIVAVGAIALLVRLTTMPIRKPPTPVIPKLAPLRKFDIVAEYAHDPNALTQGLIYAGGFLYESTGRRRPILNQESGTENGPGRSTPGHG